jgi:hypothetical protein
MHDSVDKALFIVTAFLPPGSRYRRIRSRRTGSKEEIRHLGHGLSSPLDNWSDISQGLITAVSALAIAPTTPTTLYAGTGCGVFVFH